MDFSEKLTALLTLTATKNTELADALGLGRPYVSRLKTGDRKMPANLQTVRSMAAFFAERCTSDYRRSALSEFTGDQRPSASPGVPALTDTIYDWLTGVKRPAESPASRFLTSFELFSQDNVPAEAPPDCGRLPEARGILSYTGNEGKRLALRDLMNYVESLHAPCTAHLFTDENYEWLIEDPVFSSWLNAALVRQTADGVTFERIQPPFGSVEFTFSAIERWMPAYMAGAIEQYHYPWPRDQLHRRTIFVVPGHIAMCANSVYGARQSTITILTRDPGIVDICRAEYDAIRQRCVPAIRTYSAGSEYLFTESEAVAAIEEAGVYKTNSLSINTLPPEISARIRALGTPFAQRLCESFTLRAQSRIHVLQSHPITDIMRLSDPADVLAGRVQIPGTPSLADGVLHYTPQEYRAHLARILWYLDTFPNYHAVFTDEPKNESVVVYVKGNRRAMLVKQTPPFAVFDVTERTMATAFCDYLKRIAEDRMTPGARRATIELLQEQIRLLSEA